MTFVKQLVEFVINPLAMSAGVALSLWVLLGPLRIDRLGAAGQHGISTTADRPAHVSRQDTPARPDRPHAPGNQLAGLPEQGNAATKDLSLAPADQPARPSGRIASTMQDLPLGAGDSGPLVTQLQGALIKNGYSVGLAGADGNLNDETLASLQEFQDNAALPVQPTCDQDCWTALGLSRPE
jgi:hypothetical protein